ncbi:MAG: cytochrome c-type biogenesis protein CcmH [Oleiphilaceae bacterium]|nr:cytochrome c-type biogenesis protein CcmH [Oleiphilaceae bacterium]
MVRVLLLVLLLLPGFALSDTSDLYPLDSEVKEERFRSLVKELRCPKCQNQNIADSNAPIAKDMRDDVYRMVAAGASEEEVVSSVVSRFGEFVRYTPQFEGRTLVLWATPALVILVGLMAIFVVVVRSRRNSETASQLTDEQRRRADEILNDTGPY